MKKILISTVAILSLGASAATAGGLAPAVMDDTVVITEPVGVAGGLSTGAIVGGVLAVAAIAALIADDDDDDDDDAAATTTQ